MQGRGVKRTLRLPPGSMMFLTESAFVMPEFDPGIIFFQRKWVAGS
jgi:hypothetical protein